jgi:ATP-independent RNA helicase DbpA
VLKHLRSGTVDLRGLQTFVLDEADRMLDMGFMDELDAILAFVPEARQTSLFSATYPEAITSMSARVQRDPVVVDVTNTEQPVRISQRWCAVTVKNRNNALLDALRAWGGALNLVFCNTRVDCMELTAFLQSNGVAALALHGDLDQPRRTQALVRFSNKSASVLVATDVAARGLDVDDVDVVFNYELPAQPEVYIHRIGRTGRVGKKGEAVSLVETREMRRLQEIHALLPDDALRSCAIPDAKRPLALLSPSMTTLQVNGGRKNKLRPGDLLGALTAEGGVPGDAVGSIDLFDTHGYMAVRNAEARKALQQLRNRPIKGKKYRARILK